MDLDREPLLEHGERPLLGPVAFDGVPEEQFAGEDLLVDGLQDRRFVLAGVEAVVEAVDEVDVCSVVGSGSAPESSSDFAQAMNGAPGRTIRAARFSIRASCAAPDVDARLPLAATHRRVLRSPCTLDVGVSRVPASSRPGDVLLDVVGACFRCRSDQASASARMLWMRSRAPRICVRSSSSQRRGCGRFARTNRRAVDPTSAQRLSIRGVWFRLARRMLTARSWSCLAVVMTSACSVSPLVGEYEGSAPPANVQPGDEWVAAKLRLSADGSAWWFPAGTPADRNYRFILRGCWSVDSSVSGTETVTVFPVEHDRSSRLTFDVVPGPGHAALVGKDGGQLVRTR